MRDELPEFARFIVAGAANTGISYAVYLLLLVLMPYLAAYTISYLVGIVISYLLLTRFVFRTPRRLATAVRFPLVYVAQYLIGSTVIVLLVETMGVRASIAAIVAIVVSIPVTFALSRLLLRARI
jgi:putative flippase GtrA